MGRMLSRGFPGGILCDREEKRKTKPRRERNHMNKQREVRTFPTSVRVSGSGNSITGHAAVFNSPYDSGFFVETIKPGAFSRALREQQDVRCLLNHDANFLLGRSKAGTLFLSEDAQGLYFNCELPDSSTGNDVRASIARGDLDGCSFSFLVGESGRQEWREAKDQSGRMRSYRDIFEIEELFDIGPVTWPAYSSTSVGVRSMFPEGVPSAVRSHVPALRDVHIPGKPSLSSDQPISRELAHYRTRLLLDDLGI